MNDERRERVVAGDLAGVCNSILTMRPESVAKVVLLAGVRQVTAAATALLRATPVGR